MADCYNRLEQFVVRLSILPQTLLQSAAISQKAFRSIPEVKTRVLARIRSALDWLDRLPTGRQRVAAGIALIFVGVAVAGLVNMASRLSNRFLSSSPDPAVALDCAPALLPEGLPLYVVYLHPKWKSLLARGQIDSGARSLGTAYACKVLAQGQAVFSGFSMTLQVTFESSKARQRTREVTVSSPVQLSATSPFEFYIVDDTGWIPDVVLPVAGSARVGQDSETQSIRILHSTANGQPAQLRGFGLPARP